MPLPSYRTIAIHPLAPAKPPLGAVCNGCGVCCLAEPCPVGMVLSLRRRGACKALQWHAQAGVYRCGAAEVGRHWGAHGPQWVRQGVRRVRALLQALVRRWIAAGQGCDCDWQA